MEIGALSVNVKVIGAGGSAYGRRILAGIASVFGIDLRVEEVKFEKHGFDFEDESWTWKEFGDAVTKRYNLPDRMELVYALLERDPDLRAQVAAWPILTDRTDLDPIR